MVKNLPASTGDSGDVALIPGSRRFPGEGNSYPLQYPCPGNFMDRRAWQAIVRGVARSWTWLSVPEHECLTYTFPFDCCHNPMSWVEILSYYRDGKLMPRNVMRFPQGHRVNVTAGSQAPSLFFLPPHLFVPVQMLGIYQVQRDQENTSQFVTGLLTGKSRAKVTERAEMCVCAVTRSCWTL